MQEFGKFWTIYRRVDKTTLGEYGSPQEVIDAANILKEQTGKNYFILECKAYTGKPPETIDLTATKDNDQSANVSLQQNDLSLNKGK